ncbi:hypothetical protein [Chitinophaga caseinilytica]|uniref:Lipoprotein n=1 Tax=Chitinophaga caseinilytica TaxID=2267521 RepID=A0ABZ2YZR6_9BACT
MWDAAAPAEWLISGCKTSTMRNCSFLCLIVAFCSLGCNSGTTPANFQQEILINDPGMHLSAVYPDSTQFHFEYQAGGISGRSQSLTLLPAIMRVSWYDRDFAFVTVSCGTSCVLGYLQPLNGRDSAQLYFQPLFTDREKQLIVNTDDGKLQVENYRTRRRVFYKHELPPPYDMAFIDSIRLEGPYAVVYYNIEGEHRKTVRINVSALLAPH